MDFSIIFSNFDIFVEGLWNTVFLVTVSIVISLCAAIPLTVLRTSENPWISRPIQFYIYCFRGVPLLVQMYIIYYGMGQFAFIKNSLPWYFFKEPYFCVILAFTLNSCAYTTEILKGAVENTASGEIEAAVAAGMSFLQRFRRIILPSAFRRALPAYSNEVIFLLHDSSLASVVAIVDITGAARIINSEYYSPYEAFLTAALFYTVLTFVIAWLFKIIERKWNRHL